MSLVEVVSSESNRYATNRKFQFVKNKIKKVTVEVLRQEIVAARILGEVSAAERIVEMLVSNPKMERDELEAELHIFAAGCCNVASEILGSKWNFEVDNVLQAHGYYNKEQEAGVKQVLLSQ